MTPCLRLIGSCLLLFLIAACAPKAERLGSADFETYFPATIEGKDLKIRVAVSDQELSQGLMHHPRLKPDHGMLFVFKTPGQRSFWMRNTQIPLDLGYFDSEGRLIEIHALYPYDETSVVSRSQQILMALEMNQGWFKANQIRQGDRLNVSDVKAALRARGVDPAQTALSADTP